VALIGRPFGGRSCNRTWTPTECVGSMPLVHGAAEKTTFRRTDGAGCRLSRSSSIKNPRGELPTAGQFLLSPGGQFFISPSSPVAVGSTAEGGDARAGGGIGRAPVEGAGFCYASLARTLGTVANGQELRRGRRLADLQATGALGGESWLGERFERHRRNGDIVRQELIAKKGLFVSLRTIERGGGTISGALAGQARATMRFETAPGKQSFGENVLLLGPPGVGKTHLPIALGREAITAGHSVLFVTAIALVASLAKGHAQGRLEERLITYIKPKP
jgi:hypothetical protein